MIDTAEDTAPERSSGEWPRLLTFVAALAVAACADDGLRVEGPRARALFEDYSATWVLDTMVSDPVPEMSERRFAPSEPFGGGGPVGGRPRPGMGGGSGGAMPPAGGMTGGRRGPMRGIDRGSMEAIRRMMSVARQRPARITLTLEDSLFTVHPAPGHPVVVPTSGEEVEFPDGSWPDQAKVEWNDLQPSLERSFGGSGRIVDHFEIVGRTRLVLTRTVEVSRRDDVRMVFVYVREGSPGDDRK